MKEPLITRSSRGVRAGIEKSRPAPVGGWNARDPEASMSPKDALWLENLFPMPQNVELRKGATYFATASPGKVKTLFPYNSPATNKFFAATDTGIFDVSTGGAFGASLLALQNGVFSYINMTVAGGTYILATNGIDNLLAYDGATWKFITDVTTPAITGTNTSNFSHVNMHKRRVWFVGKGSMSAWYLPVNLIAGAATEFPLGQLFHRGGYLMAMATWTVDTTQGSDDYAVFITSEGEIAIYKGTDPATDFTLVGVYYVGEPVGRQCYAKYGGDLLILTQTGLYPLSRALQSITINRAAAISGKIDPIFSQAASSYGAYKGWKIIVYPTENILMVNVPVIEGLTSYQLAMNTITGAWGLFTGWNAFCWAIWQGRLYFGGTNFVAQALVGNDDFGAAIVGKARTAFDYFDTPMQKHVTLFRPLLKLSGNANVQLGLDTDFDNYDLSGSIDATLPATSVWDTAVWDSAVWAADYAAKKDWRTVFSYTGFCAALRLQISAKGVRVGWSSTDYYFLKGGVL